jgi:hypothetical protein
MTDTNDQSTRQTWVEPAVRELWVEPEIRQLDISETFARPGRGRDGGIVRPDCTRS